MSYIDNALLPNEQIVYRTKKHPILFIVPILWMVITYGFSISSNPVLIKFEFIPAAVTLIAWATASLTYIASEFAVTNKRIMMTEGFFSRHSNETWLSTIANVTVDQNLLGRILNFGTVLINSFSGEKDPFLLIAFPQELRRQVHLQLNQIGK